MKTVSTSDRIFDLLSIASRLTLSNICFFLAGDSKDDPRRWLMCAFIAAGVLAGCATASQIVSYRRNTNRG